VRKCGPDGISVSVNFADVFIPASMLMEPSYYDEAERLFVWQYAGHDLFYDLG
jgi:DNA-directed RNA polymerase subunit E'/Rpb7